MFLLTYHFHVFIWMSLHFFFICPWHMFVIYLLSIERAGLYFLLCLSIHSIYFNMNVHPYNLCYAVSWPLALGIEWPLQKKKFIKAVLEIMWFNIPVTTSVQIKKSENCKHKNHIKFPRVIDPNNLPMTYGMFKLNLFMEW